MAEGTATADGGVVLPEVGVTASRLAPPAPPPSPGAPPVDKGPKPGRDELVVTAGILRVAGWQAVRVTRSCEAFPSSYDIGLTEKFPSRPASGPVLPGQVCKVQIGDDLVITGYADRLLMQMASESHTVRLVGRGAGCDLRDCMVTWTGLQISGTSVRDLAEKLAAPSGVTVVAKDGDGPPIPAISINLGETPYEVIERCARWAGMLVYEDAEGRLVLAQVSKERHSSGFREGVNVLRAGVSLTLDERYTSYVGYSSTTDTWGQAADPGSTNLSNLRAEVEDPQLQDLKRPDGQKRVRKLAIFGEQMVDGKSLLTQRVNWEMTRRRGRSRAVRLEADSWRDSAGRLWEPNRLAQVDLPTLKIADEAMIIGEVTYLRDERGTRAELLLMPPEAFAPEPSALQPGAWGTLLHQDQTPGTGTAAPDRSQYQSGRDRGAAFDPSNSNDYRFGRDR